MPQVPNVKTGQFFADIRAIVVTRRKVIISLVMNFSVLWALSVLYWMGCSHARAMEIWLAPTAPLYFGLFFFFLNPFHVTLISLIVAAITIRICLEVVIKPRTVTLIIAHIFLVVYWFWSFCLIEFVYRMN